MDIVPRTMSRIIKQDLELSNNKQDIIALKENRKKIKTAVVVEQ